MLEIEIQQGDITKIKADAIVNPANVLGWMGSVSGSAIKSAGGIEIEKEAVNKGPMEIGRAVATTSGELPHQVVIHSPTMENPSEKAKAYNVQMAVHGALHLADDLKLSTLAMPGMGTGVGEFPVKDSAKIMAEEIKKFVPRHLEKVVLIDIDEAMVKAWQKEV